MSPPASYILIFQSILKNFGLLLRTEAKSRAVALVFLVVCFLLSLYLFYKWLVVQYKINMATKTADFRKMSTKISIFLSATTFSKNQVRVEIMNTSFASAVSANIYV